ncbi:hypothetical protein AVEN_265480-1 [Araneus ventricosus]|uniref:Uncharacterized protein n=1 Tax=Araneus ventricosus TaxID=182803 RepID=A0A4Y2CG96_ARAVE|nr:hypothetical protein AVEN_265480-1 [Araneus ventricosus]
MFQPYGRQPIETSHSPTILRTSRSSGAEKAKLGFLRKTHYDTNYSLPTSSNLLPTPTTAETNSKFIGARLLVTGGIKNTTVTRACSTLTFRQANKPLCRHEKANGQVFDTNIPFHNVVFRRLRAKISNDRHVICELN